MPFGPTEVDPAVLHLLLRRLSELETEAHGVTDTVLGLVPYAGPDVGHGGVREAGAGVGTALVDAFSTLGDSVGQTRLAVAAAYALHVPPPAEIDLRVI